MQAPEVASKHAASSAPATFNDEQICWDYTAGRCKKGDACKWLHVDDAAAKAAAARTLMRMGRGYQVHGVSEAYTKLATLFWEANLMDDDSGGAVPGQQEDWSRRCEIMHQKPSTLVNVRIGMDSAGLDDLGMLAWAYWFDKQLEVLGSQLEIKAEMVDFSGNEFGDYGTSALFTLLEKHGIRCYSLCLDGNLICDRALRDVTRYLTSSDKAPVEELSMAENKFSAKGIGWLLASMALHPAYPVWHDDIRRFKPLRLKLGETFDHGSATEDGTNECDDLVSVLQDLGDASYASVIVDNGKDNSRNAALPSKSNCITHLLSWSAPSGWKVPSNAPHAKPYFAFPFQEAELVADQQLRMNPCLLFEDDLFAVVYKPAGWTCGMSAMDGGTLSQIDPQNLPTTEDRDRFLEDLVYRSDSACIKTWICLSMGYEEASEANRDPKAEYGLCHRLDVGTSGPMLVGKTTESYEYAKQQIRDRDVVKDYLALVHGRFPQPRGICNDPVDRSDYDQSRKVRVHKNGQPAQTIWEVVAEYEATDAQKTPFTLVHLRLITGRTHQIRVHMAHMGHPLVSDWQYQDNREVLRRDDQLCKRIFLHKFRISFMDMEGFPVNVSSPLRMDPTLWATLEKLRLVGGMALSGCAAPGLRAGSGSGGGDETGRGAAAKAGVKRPRLVPTSK